MVKNLEILWSFNRVDPSFIFVLIAPYTSLTLDSYMKSMSFRFAFDVKIVVWILIYFLFSNIISGVDHMKFKSGQVTSDESMCASPEHQCHSLGAM
jgi:hypothetical protein